MSSKSRVDSFQTVDDHFAHSVPEVGESEQEESDIESDDESTGGPHADEVHILDFWVDTLIYIFILIESK